MKLPQQSKIRWTRKDYITLGKAVAQFNRKINELNTEGNKLYLPETQSYYNVKENISSRSELNRVINSLKRFSKAGAESLYITEGGQEITKWEYGELIKQRAIARRRLKAEMVQLETTPIEGNFTRVQMGSDDYRKAKRTLESLEDLDKLKGYEFKRLSNRIKAIGTSDYNINKAEVFRNNIMNELEDLKSYIPEFKKVFDYFANIGNPISFYNVIQKSDVLMDFFKWYKGDIIYSGFNTLVEIADWIIENYRIQEEQEADEEQESEEYIRKNLRRRKRYALIVNGKLITSSINLNKIYDLFKEYKDRGERVKIIDLETNRVIEN